MRVRRMSPQLPIEHPNSHEGPRPVPFLLTSPEADRHILKNASDAAASCEVRLEKRVLPKVDEIIEQI